MPVAAIAWLASPDQTFGKGNDRMKAFIAGTAAAILISVIAGVVMNVAGPTSATKFSTDSVRLSD